MEQQDMERWLSCYVCGQMLGSDFQEILKHSCFSIFDASVHVFEVNDYDQIYIANRCEPNNNGDLETETQVLTPKETSVPDLTPSNNSKATDSRIINDELLIEAVRTKKSLWDMSKSKMPVQTKDLWSKVCCEIGLPPEMRTEVSNRWTNLRNRYLKARKTHLGYLKSGSAAKKPKFQSGFIFYDQMSFLSETTDVPETHSSLIPQMQNDPVKIIAPASKNGIQKSGTCSNLSSQVREEFEALCRVNDQKIREIPTPEENKKSADKKRKGLDINNRILEILEDTNSKVPMGLEGFCNQVAEILMIVKNPIKRLSLQAELLLFLSEKMQKMNLID